MSHRRRRVSRLLLAVLALTIAVGLFTYIQRVSSSKAANTTAAAPSATSPAAVAADGVAPLAAPAAALTPQPAQPDTLQPLRTQTPSALVTETPSAPAAGSTGPDAGPVPSVTIIALGEKPAAPFPAPSASQGKVTIQPYAAPNGGSSPSVRTTAASGPAAIAQGRAKMQAGNLLEARDTVNAALASGRLGAGDAAAARRLLSEINQTIVFSPRRFADDRWGGTYSVQSGDRLDRIGARYGLTPALLMRLNGISDARRLRAGATIKVLKGPFHAVVNKNAFRLDLYLGAPGGPESVYVTSYPVGLGANDSTPEGKWLVEAEKKIRNPVYYSPRGEGIIEADDPRNPLGEYWIGLAGTEGDAVGKESYGIHGTIEPDSIGKQASMGCVRMRNEDVGVVFDALMEGKSTVVVVD